MPITIIERPEALTEAALLASDPPLLIRSTAVGLLTHELRRYCKREVSGRSFLIAGHRGAGKTTLVLNACQEIFKESDDGRFPLRPLLVMLQGPNLLPNDKDELPVAENGEKKDAASKKISPMENVLRQITLGLYRAFAREISQAFRRHAKDLAAGPDSGTGIPRGELLEFAAALELELDEYPGRSRLRQFWRMAGALKSGVLRHYEHETGYVPVFTGPLRLFRFPFSFATGRVPDAGSLVRDQGLRELVALCSACEAYRRISGTFTSKQEDKQGAKAAEERKIETDLKGKEILGPLMPVIVGALTGTGVLAANVATGPQAAFAGALAALASSLVLKYSSSRSRERSATREDLFIPDLSVATLDRVLPVLIDRIHAAGLAPIFVIDELDKVERLSTRIPEMVRRLKKLVAENAFFCFLTDRTYYEEMRERALKKPYSIEHTYFTHQVFIIFKHRDLHNFLGDVLKAPELAQPSASATATVSPTERDAQNLIKLERDDREVLPYVFLYAARMHSIDLRRELVLIRGEKGIVNLTAGVVQGNRRYGLELQMQVAIETLLDEEDMERELDRHPAFRRLAHDALYYLAERWEDADDNLDLSDDSDRPLAKFKKYLCSRMTTDPPEKTEGSETQPVATTNSDPIPPTITNSDLDFLWTRVRDLAALLSSCETLLTRARQRGATAGTTATGNMPGPAVRQNAPPPFPEVVLNAVSEDSLLARLDGKNHRYRWCWHPAGRPIAGAPGAPASEEKASSWRQHVEFIRAFEKELSNLTKNGATFFDLGANLKIINTAPPWKTVEEAMSKLETFGTKGTYGSQVDDTDQVAKFDALLQRSAATIAYALCAAEVLELWGKSETVTGIAQGLGAISTGLSFGTASEASVAESMKEVFRQIHSQFSSNEAPVPPPVVDKSGIEPWREWVRAETERAQSALRPSVLERLPDILKRAWEHWYARLSGLSGGGFAPVSLDILICARRGTGPWSHFTLPIREMTINKWSAAFFGALNIGPAGDVDEQPPPWLALAALSYLGFASRVANLRKKGSAEIGRLRGEVSEMGLEAIENWSLPHGLFTPKRSAVVLGRGEGSADVGAWKPDLEFPVLTMSRPQGEALIKKQMLADLQKLLSPDLAIFDLTAPPLAQEEGRSEAPGRRELPPADWLEKVFWQTASRLPLSRDVPIVVLPQDWEGPPEGHFRIINPKSSKDLFRPLTHQEETAL
jgi:hypothetical protein